jgi:hypothetical protein
MKARFVFVLCWTLIFNLVTITKVRTNTSPFEGVSVSASFFIGEAQAQSEALTLSAKSNNSNMAQYYLPMLAMLGIGIMAIMLWTKLEAKSADFYLFLMGAVTYLVSVITSWSSEKSKFEKLPESIAKDTQVSALEEQKKAYEEVLNMVEKRLMLQGATTAAFLAAAILAGVFYSKEKAALAAAKKGTSSLAAEFASKCAQIPQLYPPNGVAVDAKTMAPMPAICARVASMGAACLAEVGASQAQIAALNEAVRSPNGSSSMAATHEERVDLISQTSSACFDSQIPSPTQGELLSYSDPSLKGKLKQYYYSQGIDLRDQKELVVVSSDPTSSATKFVIKVLSELIEEAHAGVTGKVIEGLAKRGGTDVGQVVSNGTNATSSAAANLDDSPDRFMRQLSENPDQAMVQCQQRSSCTEADLQRYIELDRARANVNATMLGVVADSAVGNTAQASANAAGRAITRGASSSLRSSGAISKPGQAVARSAGRRVATRVASGVAIRVVGAGAVAVGSAVGAPVIVAGATVALTAYTVYSVGSATYNLASAKLKVMKAETAERRRNMDCRQTRRGVRCRPKTSFIDLLDLDPDLGKDKSFNKKQFFASLLSLIIKDTQASATASVATAALKGVGNQAVQVADEVSQESESETDQWIYNPKGRMVLFGAFSALVGLVSLNTNKMKKNLKADIAVLQETIDEYSRLNQGNSNLEVNPEIENSLEIEKGKLIPQDTNQETEQIRDTSVLNSPLNKVLSFFFKSATASKHEVLGVMPLTIPCLAPVRGRCVSTRSFVSRLLPSGVPYSPSTVKAIKSAAKMGDMIQRKNYVTKSFMKEVKVLNDLKPTLEMGYKVTKKVINAKRGSKPIPFKKYESYVVKRFLGFGKRALANTSANVNLSSLLSIGSFNGRSNKIREGKSRLESSDSKNTYAVAKSNYSSSSVRQAGNQGAEDNSFMNRNYKNDTMGINTRKSSNLFEQVSRRYLLWHSRQDRGLEE